MSSQSSHHPQEVLLAQFSLYVHKGGLKPDSFHFIFIMSNFRLTTADLMTLWWHYDDLCLLVCGCASTASSSLMFVVVGLYYWFVSSSDLIWYSIITCHCTLKTPHKVELSQCLLCPTTDWQYTLFNNNTYATRWATLNWFNQITVTFQWQHATQWAALNYFNQTIVHAQTRASSL